MANQNHNILVISEILKSLSKYEFNSFLLSVGYKSLNNISKSKQSGLNRAQKKGETSNTSSDNESTITSKILLEISNGIKANENSTTIRTRLLEKFNIKQVFNHTNLLESRLNDYLTISKNVRSLSIDNARLTQIEFYKNITFLWICFFRRINLNIKSNLISIENKLLQYELYPELITVMSFQLAFFLSSKVNLNELQVIHNRLQRYIKLLELKSTAEVTWIQVQLTAQKKIINNKFLKFLEQFILKHKEFEGEISSDSWHVLFYYINLEYYQQLEKYNEGDEICFKIINIYKSNKYLSTKTRIGTAYLQLANNQFLDLRYSESIESCNQSLKFYPIDSINLISVYEILFLSNFYLENYADANINVEKVVNAKNFRLSTIVFAKWWYFQTNLFFALKKYKEAQFSIQSSYYHEDDKEAWSIYVRILSIYILVAREFYLEVESSLENMKRFITKLKKNGSVKKRHIVIYKLLLKLHNSGYLFKNIYNENIELFNKLGSNDPQFRWNPGGGEIIRFEKWFLSNF